MSELILNETVGIHQGKLTKINDKINERIVTSVQQITFFIRMPTSEFPHKSNGGDIRTV